MFTEVLFYSAQPDFDTIAKNLYRDRVSFYSLIGDESFKGFKTKVFNLINQTVSKLQELNNIRGLVMAETSELDNTVEDILLSYLSNKSENSEKLRSYICKIVLDSANDNAKKAAKFCDLEINDIVKNRLFDADKKARAIKKLLEIIGAKEKQYLTFYENYKKDVIDKRNDLAHAKSDIIDGADCLIVTRKGQEEIEKYNQEECIQIRKNLQSYSTLLKNIRNLIVAE